MINKILNWGVVLTAPSALIETTPKLWVLGAGDLDIYLVAIIFFLAVMTSWIYCLHEILKGWIE